MAKQWHDINTPGRWGSTQKDPKPQPVEEVVDEPVKEGDPEVELSNPRFIEPENGYLVNEPCKMAVDATFLKETIRKRVLFDVFSQYRDGDEILREYSMLEGFIEDDGTAVSEMKHLWVNEHYYHDEDKTPQSRFRIWFKARHSRGTKEVESVKLELPATGGDAATLVIRLNADPAAADLQDDQFRLFSTDSAKTYDVTLGVGSDKTPGDEYLDLEFTGLDPTLNYTLVIDPGKEGDAFPSFEDKSFKELTGGK